MAKQREIKTKTFTVLIEFTYDRLYRVNESIELSDYKTIQKLLIYKIIK
jgi:hypothetical protein